MKGKMKVVRRTMLKELLGGQESLSVIMIFIYQLYHSSCQVLLVVLLAGLN